MLFALEVLRDSPADDLANRKKLIEALGKTNVSSERGRAARDRCVEAYRLLTAGKESARAAQDGLGNANEAAKSILVEIARADELLKKSEEQMPRCNEAAAALRLARR